VVDVVDGGGWLGSSARGGRGDGPGGRSPSWWRRQTARRLEHGATAVALFEAMLLVLVTGGLQGSCVGCTRGGAAAEV
jgi:hypothetical protein